MRRFFLPRAPTFRLWTRGHALWLLFRRFLLVGVFQEPEFNGRQVVTFHNQRDYIFVRFHRYVFSEGKGDSGKEKKTRASLQVKPLGYRKLFARFGTARRTSWGSDEPLVGRLRHGVVFSCSLQALHTQQNSWGGLNVCEALLVFPRKEHRPRPLGQRRPRVVRECVSCDDPPRMTSACFRLYAQRQTGKEICLAQDASPCVQ